MRDHAFALALLIAAGTFFAVQAQAQSQPGTAAAIEACMRDLRSGLKAGQKMTEQQRMVAETQCRARAEQAAQPVKK
ncbi:hypothetical protein [Ferrovibrio sp.]|uniref:hypothetical protein n=1 Tax=Ferrovibrio sp. TaxID=1917215 RepID=UPI000CB387C5|nr:hypothetical protein [Ferrovibrio sp.]PJI42437.1 MAG: hypothetical protein CTR53_08510 [Ferrovibrio sp.]